MGEVKDLSWLIVSLSCDTHKNIMSLLRNNNRNMLKILLIPLQNPDDCPTMLCLDKSDAV